MSVPARVIREWEEAHGVDRLGPIVNFYDHALPIESTGRPRFKAAVFVQKKTRNDPTGSTFCREATEDDKREFPREWAAYCDARDQIEHRAPPLSAIATMSPVAFEELKALDINDCRQLAEYSGDLDVLNPMRETARRIMEIANEDRRIRERRETVPDQVGRPVHGNIAGDRVTTYTHQPDGRPLPSDHQGGESVQRQAPVKRLVPGTSVECFKYEFVA